MSLTEEKANEIAQQYNSDLIAEQSDEIATLQAEADVLRNTIGLLKNENERMMKLAHDYITAYEKLAFGDVVTYSAGRITEADMRANNLTAQLHRVARERDKERELRLAAEAALADWLEDNDASRWQALYLEDLANEEE